VSQAQPVAVQRYQTDKEFVAVGVDVIIDFIDRWWRTLLGILLSDLPD